MNPEVVRDKTNFPELGQRQLQTEVKAIEILFYFC